MAYTNNLQVFGGAQTTSQDSIAQFDKIRILFYKIGGIVYPSDPANIYFCHQVCNVTDMPNMTSELRNERDVVHAGKELIQVNDGTDWSGSITLEALDWLTVQAMIGKHAGNLSGVTPGIQMQGSIPLTGDFGVQGHLILQYTSSTNRYIAHSTLITEIGIKITDSPGATNGDNTVTIELYSNDGQIYQASKGQMFIPMMWYDDGTITNAAAPDGALTAFKAEDANGAFPTVSLSNPLYFQPIDTDVSTSNPERWIKGLRLNSAKVNSSSYSVTQADATVTMDTAPADGAKLEGIGLFATGFDDWVSGRWYGPGSVVRYSGVYYQYIGTTNANGLLSTVDPASDISGAIDNWQAITTTIDLANIPYYTDNVQANNVWESTTRNFPLFSWYQLQRQGGM